MRPTHNPQKKWRSRVSIPVPADCEPTALPSELHPHERKKGGDARIELATSCTLSKNHTTRPITLDEKKLSWQKVFEARIELATSSVLDWRDNQLHHPNRQNKKCILRGSNPRGLSPLGLKSSALTTRPRMLRVLKKRGGDARIELATSCTRSKNHTTRPIT